MSNDEGSRQERREHEDPRELGRPVPWFLRGLIVLVVASGIYTILHSGLEAGPQFGDGRTLASLRAKPRAAANAAPVAADGAAIYGANCAGCHQAAGAGVPGVFPPLAGSSRVKGSDTTLVRILLHGITGTLTVSGTVYSGMMPPFKDQFGDPELAAVASYIRGQWGNGAAAISAERVAQERVATATRKDSWKGDAELPASH